MLSLWRLHCSPSCRVINIRGNLYKYATKNGTREFFYTYYSMNTAALARRSARVGMITWDTVGEGSRLGRDRQQRRSVSTLPRNANCHLDIESRAPSSLLFSIHYERSFALTFANKSKTVCAILKIGSVVDVDGRDSFRCLVRSFLSFIVSFYENYYTRVHRFDFNSKRNIVGVNFSNLTRRGNFCNFSIRRIEWFRIRITLKIWQFVFQQQRDKLRNRNINTIIM